MATDLLTSFPLAKPRPGQLETIQRILEAFESGKRFVFYEGPTGSGKSVIALTVANHLRKIQHADAFYLTSTKILQSQLAGDFANVVDLKGRNAYDCTLRRERKEEEKPASLLAKLVRGAPREKRRSCAVGVCKQAGETKCEECLPFGHEDEPGFAWITCPYWRRLREAQAAPLCNMNYKCFLFQMMARQFGPRSLLIADEVHNLESELMDFVGLTLSDKALRQIDFHLEDLGSVEAFQDHLAEVRFGEILNAERQAAFFSNNLRQVEEIERLITKYTLFQKEDPEDWVYNFRENEDRSRSVEFKPIFVRKFAEQLIFSRANYVLLMSATLVSARMLADVLGVPADGYVSLRSPNRFPKANRPIYRSFAGSMNFREKAATLPKLVQKVEEICRHYAEHRGIVHTHNFEIARRLLNDCAPDVNRRFLFQEDFSNKEEMLARHARTVGSVLVAPAMHEGLDLRDDLSRFQIICKVPYPNFKADAQLAKRMELDHSYLGYLTALKLVQSVGRSVRSETDWADTYVLDAEFDRFLRQCERFLPSWFREALGATEDDLHRPAKEAGGVELIR